MSRPLRSICAVAAILLTLAAAVVLVGRAPRVSARSVTRDGLRSTFDADTGRLVYRWDPADPRPEAERRAALFDFMYQSYDSSAWIPQSLFDSNLVTQAVIGDVDTIVSRKVGLVRWRESAMVPAYGMAPDLRADGPLRWTVNCLVCHTAEIDGVAYFGAGTKLFDDRWLGEALRTLTSERWSSVVSSDPADRTLAADANRILNSHHHDKIDSLTRARSTAFAASHVELYLRPNGRMPAVDEVGRGDTKTPPLWHTAAKMSSRRWYVDGSFHGSFPMMASSMELEKDRSFDALVTSVIPTIKHEFAAVIQHLRPPVYPYEIDAALAARGKTLFYSDKIGCANCHGDYDGRGNVDWPGLHKDVGTDRARLDVVSDQFIDAFESSPLAAEGALIKSRGYAATPLTGVWANYPYLHNGSVPTLYHLLGPVSERPAIFQVLAAGRFDRSRVGQILFLEPAHGRLDIAELTRRFGDNRDWFNTARPGAANRGHDMWPRIRTNENRRALIEYLKTL